MLLKITTRLLIIVLSILFAAYIVPGIVVTGFYTALITAVILGFINLIVRPILIILTLPITIISLGLFIFVINALLFWFVASFIDGFYVEGFVPALLGALIVSVFSWVGGHFLKD